MPVSFYRTIPTSLEKSPGGLHAKCQAPPRSGVGYINGRVERPDQPARRRTTLAENDALIALAEKMATFSRQHMSEERLGDCLELLPRPDLAASTAFAGCSGGRHASGQPSGRCGLLMWEAACRAGSVLAALSSTATPLIISHPKQHCALFPRGTPSIEEVLLVPFYAAGKAVGTIWVIVTDQKVMVFVHRRPAHHDQSRHFRRGGLPKLCSI